MGHPFFVPDRLTLPIKNMHPILAQVRSELQKLADPEIASTSQRFFKEPITVYGLKAASIHQLSKASFKEIKSLPKAEIFELCDQLWQWGYHEEAIIACLWAYELRKSYTIDDFAVFERWIKSYVSNWAQCDTLCNHPVGDLVMLYPELISKLKTFTKSDNRWVRRAAAVSLIIPARRGKFLPDIFEIANRLLTDADDLVQKGYGWMLKAASEAHQQKVFEYVMSKKAVMPRTALRYAIEKMPKEFKAEAMKK